MDSLELFALRRQNVTLSRRLAIVESILEQAGIVDAVLQGPQVDPSPDDLGRAGALGGLGGLGGPGGGLPPFADPAPDDIVRGVTINRQTLAEILRRFRPGDPAPVDISRFTRVQVESALHGIAAERARLDSLETMLREQINTGGG
jgi:hypothetical protein